MVVEQRDEVVVPPRPVRLRPLPPREPPAEQQRPALIVQVQVQNLPLLENQALAKTPELDLPLRRLYPGLRAPNELAEDAVDEREGVCVRVLRVRDFREGVEDEGEAREAGDGAGEEGD